MKYDIDIWSMTKALEIGFAECKMNEEGHNLKWYNPEYVRCGGNFQVGSVETTTMVGNCDEERGQSR